MNKSRRVVMLLIALAGQSWAGGDDFSDGIGEVSDESIIADDKLGDKDVNIRYVISYAIAKAKRAKNTAMDRARKAARNGTVDQINNTIQRTGERVSSGDIVNSGENNENSIVVAPGSHVNTAINVVIDRGSR